MANTGKSKESFEVLLAMGFLIALSLFVGILLDIKPTPFVPLVFLALFCWILVVVTYWAGHFIKSRKSGNR